MVGEEFVVWFLGIFLVLCIVVDVVIDGLFGKYCWFGFEVVWFLVCIELVFVGVIFDQVIGWIFEVLEIS